MKNKHTLKQISVSDYDISIIQATHQVYRINSKEVSGYFKLISTDKKNKEELDDIDRKLAYEELAIYFGLAEYIPHSEYCVLLTETKNYTGCFQEPSKGINIWNIPSEQRTIKITPSLQRALSKMRLFDVICHEADHSLNNYYPVLNENGDFVSVSMFDNGGVGTFGKTSSIGYNTYCGCAPLFSQDDHFILPYQDKELIERIINARFFSLFKTLNPYIGSLSILFTWVRIKKICKAIKKDRKNGRLVELSPNDWSGAILFDELSGKYGNTYLFSMVHDWGGDGKRPRKQ